MRRHKILQSPFMPLFFLILIISGYMFGHKAEKAQETAAEESQTVQEEQSKEEDAEPTQEPSVTVVEDTRTNAEVALERGSNLSQEITDEYAKKVVDLYCSRKAAECSSSNLVRKNEEWTYQQTFDEMSGFMGLVKLSAGEETESEFKVSTELEDVTAVLVFPDQTYVKLECNKEITCPMPAGNSIILYIGEHLKGSIQVEVEENESIICKRM